MNLSQQNYSATERECLAVVSGIKEFRTYLFGQHFTVVTDHHSVMGYEELSMLLSPKSQVGLVRESKYRKVYF